MRHHIVPNAPLAQRKQQFRYAAKQLWRVQQAFRFGRAAFLQQLIHRNICQRRQRRARIPQRAFQQRKRVFRRQTHPVFRRDAHEHLRQQGIGVHQRAVEVPQARADVRERNLARHDFIRRAENVFRHFRRMHKRVALVLGQHRRARCRRGQKSNAMPCASRRHSGEISAIGSDNSSSSSRRNASSGDSTASCLPPGNSHKCAFCALRPGGR